MISDSILRLQQVLFSDDGLMMLLRYGHGLNHDKFKETCEILKVIAAELSETNEVPKILVNIFVTLYPTMESCSYMYNQAEAEKIREAAEIILDLIGECVAI